MGSSYYKETDWEYVYTFKTLDSRVFNIYRKLAPPTGRYYGMMYVGEPIPTSVGKRIFFQFNITETAAVTLCDEIGSVERLLKGTGLKHFHLLLERLDYGAEEQITVNHTPEKGLLDPDTYDWHLKHIERISIDILDALHRGQLDRKHVLSLADLRDKCFAPPDMLHTSIRYLIDDALVMSPKDNYFSLTKKGHTELSLMKKQQKTREPNSMARDFFICHASEDKDEVAIPLSEMLIAAGHTVWLDRYELTIGDRLMRSIDQGLLNSKYGVVILSPSFFEKNGPLMSWML